MSIAKLYYQYGKTTDEEILNYLNRIIIFREINGKFFKIPILEEISLFNNISFRNISFRERALNMLNITLNDEIFHNQLELVDIIPFLCKSVSGFIPRFNVGEIFDQISELNYNNITHIECFNNYKTLNDTNSEHHIMMCKLYKTIDLSYVSDI